MKKFIKDAIQVWIDYRLDISFSKRIFGGRSLLNGIKNLEGGFPGV